MSYMELAVLYMNNDFIDTLRDVALSLEKRDKQIASDLMNFALKYRSNGPLLIKKVSEYSKVLAPRKNITHSLCEALKIVDDSYLLRLLNVCLEIEPNNSKFLGIKSKVSFSHTFNDEKVSLINFSSEGDIIPIGSRCTSAIACHYANLHKESLPFDWTIPLTPDKSLDIIEKGFKGFIPSKITIGERVVNEYGIGLAHFSEHTSTDEGVEVYKQRIARFNRVIQNTSKHKYFIYVNEDYLYNKNYRGKLFNKKKFDDVLALERYFKGNFPGLSFKILYFDFVNHEHRINESSSVIPIYIETEKFWNISQISNYPAFRKYVGKILSELFSTKFNGSVKILDLFTL